MATTHTQAVEAAALTAGRTTRLSTTLTDATDRLHPSPDPWALPAPTDAGFAVDTMSADVRVSLHVDTRRRTVWLVIDPDNAPLSGDYTVALVAPDGTEISVTYTAAAVSDVPTLLQLWADELAADTDFAAAFEAPAVVAYRTPGGDVDALQIQPLLNAAVPGDGLPAGHDYATFGVDSATAAPEAAALAVVREVDSCSMRVFTKSGADWSSSITSNANKSAREGLSGWELGGNGDLGALPVWGLDERVQLAGRSGVYLHLYDPVCEMDGALAVASSGAGIYGVINAATAWVAQAVLT